MSISFTCDFCARKYKVDDGLAGRKVKCKECGTDLTIPSPVKSSPPKDLYGLDDEDVGVAPPPPRRPGMAPEPGSGRGKAKRESSGIKAVLSIAGVVLVSLAVGLRVLARVMRVLRPAFNQAGQAAPNNPGNPFAQPLQGFGGPPPAGEARDLGRVAITGGGASTGRGPAGIGTMGVEFRIEYRVESQPPGVMMYDLIIRSSKGRTKVVPPVTLRGSGTVDVTVPSMTQNEGPFEICFEAESFGPGGMARSQVSDLVTMNWSNAPPVEPQLGPPGFPNNPGAGNLSGPPGFPNNPGAGNMPGQPGFRPPGMPQMPQRPRMPQIPIGPRGPRFGPGGRP